MLHLHHRFSEKHKKQAKDTKHVEEKVEHCGFVIFGQTVPLKKGVQYMKRNLLFGVHIRILTQHTWQYKTHTVQYEQFTEERSEIRHGWSLPMTDSVSECWAEPLRSRTTSV